MIGIINRLRNSAVFRKRSKGGSSTSGVHDADLPLDHQLTFNPYPDEEWSYDEGRGICFNDESVGEMVRSDGRNIRMLHGLSQGLHLYQRYVWSKNGTDGEQFNGAIDALQSVIQGKLSTIYDDLTGGVQFDCQGSDLWINGVNPRCVLNCFLANPTEKSRAYLIGFRDKLGLILSSHRSSKTGDGPYQKARDLLEDIEIALACVPADGPLRLCEHNSRGDSSECAA